MTPPASGAIPRGWRVDHERPSDFVVRCIECDRVSIRDGRAQAHKQAQTHALRCSQTGVTPVSRPEGETVADVEGGAGDSLLLEGIDPTSEDAIGREIVVRYESISSQAGIQRVTGRIELLLGTDASAQRGVEIVVEEDRRLRVNVIEETVLCEGRELEDGRSQWRTIGDAESIRPARVEDSSSETAVVTDGGAR